MKWFHLEIWMHPKKIIWEYLLFNLKIMCIICRFVIPFIGFQPFLGQESKGKKAGDDEKVNGFWFWWYRKRLHIVYCRQVYIYYILKLHYIYIWFDLLRYHFTNLDTLQKNHLGISSIWKSLPQICYPIYRASALLWPGGVQSQESWWWREGERVLILGASKKVAYCVL